VVGLSDPCGVGLSQYENVFGANRYSVGWCGSECHSVQLGGDTIVKAPYFVSVPLRFSLLGSLLPGGLLLAAKVKTGPEKIPAV
jgi:hypothetical protein